jgi:CRP-like cAMP-binding protein
VSEPELSNHLQRQTLFGSFSVSEVDALAKAGAVLIVESGKSFLKEGDVGDSMFVLLSGRAEVTKIGASGGSHVLGEVETGAVLGEVGLLTEHPRSATVTALEQCRVFRLERNAFDERLDAGCTGCRRLLKEVALLLAARSRSTNARLVELLERPCKIEESKTDFDDLQARLREALHRHV